MWDIKIHTKCIFPFSYSDVLYDELQEKNDSWIIDEASTTESDIYNYVRDSFLTSNDSELADHSIKIGCAYRYAGGHLPDDFRLKYIHKDNNQEFYIREVHLVLFQTGIGILWFSPEVVGCFSSEVVAIMGVLLSTSANFFARSSESYSSPVILMLSNSFLSPLKSL